MAVSKELKAYINRRFDSKINELRKNKEEMKKRLIERKLKSKKENLNEIFNGLETIKSMIKNTMEDYSNHLSFSYYWERVLNDTPTVMISSDEEENIKTELMQFDKEINELEHKRETLLVRLSLEKDFDKINEILKENEIGL